MSAFQSLLFGFIVDRPTERNGFQLVGQMQQTGTIRRGRRQFSPCADRVFDELAIEIPLHSGTATFGDHSHI